MLIEFKFQNKTKWLIWHQIKKKIEVNFIVWFKTQVRTIAIFSLSII